MDVRNKKVAVVTGGTGAIGSAIAEKIAGLPDWKVVLVVRDRIRGEETAGEIRRNTGNPDVGFRVADLGSGASIKAMREGWDGPVHALINNAASAPRRREETVEGVEAQWGINVVGYWRMALAFKDLLTAAAPSRIINVASYWAGGLNLTDPEFRRRPYNNDAAYRQSKQANRLMSVILSGEWNDFGISVNACHPGDVNSHLSNNLGFGGSETPEEGADTPCWLATAAEASGISGKWVNSRKAGNDEFAMDAGMMTGLWQLLHHYT